MQELARSNIKVLAKGKGGNTKFVCTHCRKEFTGSLTRQLAHLTGTFGNGIAACNDSDLIQEVGSGAIGTHQVRVKGFK